MAGSDLARITEAHETMQTALHSHKEGTFAKGLIFLCVLYFLNQFNYLPFLFWLTEVWFS